MKNYLIITLGTREIQLLKAEIGKHGFEVISEVRGADRVLTFVQPLEKPNLRIAVRSSDEFKDVFTISPRIAGKLICENFELFEKIIDWPLIRPAIDYLKNLQVKIDIVMLISTDQEEGHLNGSVKPQNYNNDTIYFGEIVERLIRKDKYFENTQIDHFGVYSNVTDMNFQYEHFNKIKKELLYENEITKVYLFPQGGIDQINQSLTLRLIEIFKRDVVQLQNSESTGIRELSFPKQFLDTLNKQKLKKHLDDYDFGMIDKDLSSESKVYHLAQYAYKRLNLQYDVLKINSDVLGIIPVLSFKKDDNSKLLDLYLAAKINYYQKAYTEFIWRIYTLNECLFKVEIEKVIGKINKRMITKDLRIEPTKFQNILNKISLSLKERLDISRTSEGNPIDSRNPNRLAFKILLPELVSLGKLNISQELLALYEKVGLKLEELSMIRNQIAHNLGAATLAQIEGKLKEKERGYTTESLFADLDQIFDLKSPYGIYDDIKAEIEKLL